MALDILIEELDESLWVAALDNGKLQGLEVDPVAEEVRWGSIYLARVISIDKAQDAAYVDLDEDNVGILYNRDVRTIQEDGRYKKGGDEAIGKTLKAGDFVVVQAKASYLPQSDDDDLTIENKTPQVSMDITLPGRYMIYCPTMNNNRISQRIRDKERRKQLDAMIDNLTDIKGCILRAASADMQTDILVREGKILKEAWEQMQAHFDGASPQLIMIGPDAIQRTLSDHATKQIERIEIVTMDHYTQVEEWCTIFAPDLVPKIEPVELENAVEDFALFDYRDIMGQLEALFQSYAVLPSGGNIILQETAALTAIDVNSGSAKSGRLAVNIEAAKEIARQIRLRNTGGIIVIDFLKMKDKKEEKALLKVLEDVLNEDPCTVQIHGLTKLGLMELTRKRRTPALEDRFEAFP